MQCAGCPERASLVRGAVSDLGNRFGVIHGDKTLVQQPCEGDPDATHLAEALQESTDRLVAVHDDKGTSQALREVVPPSCSSSIPLSVFTRTMVRSMTFSTQSSECGPDAPLIATQAIGREPRVDLFAVEHAVQAYH